LSATGCRRRAAGCSVQAIAVEKRIVLDKIDRHIAARKSGAPHAAPALANPRGNAQRNVHVSMSVPGNAAVQRHHDTHVVAERSDDERQNPQHVPEPPVMAKGLTSEETKRMRFFMPRF
jgi:hypothetical protein